MRMFRARRRSPSGRRRRTAARRTAWSASAAGRAPTPAACTTRSSTRLPRRREGDHRRLPGPDRDGVRHGRPRLRARRRRAAPALPAPVDPQRRRGWTSSRYAARFGTRRGRRLPRPPDVGGRSGCSDAMPAAGVPTAPGWSGRTRWAVVLLRPRCSPHGGVRAEMNLSILYRGPLSSCNYACAYCPFAKRTETAAELAHDRDLPGAVRRVGWRPARGHDRRAVHPVGRGTRAAGGIRTRWRRSRTAALSQGGDPDEPVVPARLGGRRATRPSWRCGAPSTRPRRPASASWRSAASCSAAGCGSASAWWG